MNLKETLEQVLATRSSAFLANDPLSFPRRFADPADREIAAFFSASLAYGRVTIIRNNLEDLFRRMPEGPAAFVRRFDPVKDGVRLEGFRHRFNSGKDLACLSWLLRCVLEESGSIERFFLLGDDRTSADIGPALVSFCRRILALDVSAVYGRRELPADATVRYFFPSPAGGSACKRLCMLLRWLCRPDDGVDLGLWQGISPARLVMPMDTHTARISRLLGMTRRRIPDWRMALEVTESLRSFDKGDPVRYDFALSHLGISEGCTGKQGEACISCAVGGMCGVVGKG